MDTMTLLCNLHADGPLTLRRLHGIGCHSFQALARLSPQELAQALDSDEAFARRFLGEAAALVRRFEGVDFEPEEVTMGGYHPGQAQMNLTPQPVTPQPVIPQPQGVPLSVGLLEGLDATWCRVLQEKGIVTLEELWHAPGLELARSIDRPLTELLDLQCHAKHHIAESAVAKAEPLKRESTPAAPLPEAESEYIISTRTAPRPPSEIVQDPRPYPTDLVSERDNPTGVTSAGGPFA